MAVPSSGAKLEHPLTRTSAIVEGTITRIDYSFDEMDGPRNIAMLEDVVVHAGSVGERNPSSLNLNSFGGYLPNGHFKAMAHLQLPMEGTRVLVFLRNDDWFFSPIVGDYHFRIVTTFGRPILISDDGTGVTGFGSHGPRFGAAVFSPSDLAATPEPNSNKALIAQQHAKGLYGVHEFIAAIRQHAETTGTDVSGDFFRFPKLNARHPKWNLIQLDPADGAIASEPLPTMCQNANQPVGDQASDDEQICIEGGAQ